MLDIYRLRKKNGITQQRLAEILKVDQTAISQWERGAANPAVDRLPELAKAFNCTIDDLFGSIKR